MMHPPIHPPQKLPALPGGMDEILQQGSVEQQSQLWMSLGFELWQEMRGETLERHIQREAIAKHDKMPRAKQPIIRPSLSSLRRTQLWLHPAGLVAVVNAYSRSGEEWSVEPVVLTGCEEQGYADPYTRLRRPDGSSTQTLRWRSGTGWHDFQQAAAAGRLVPFSRWLDDLDQPFPFENALSWEGVRVPGALHNPSDRSKAHARLLAVHWRKVRSHWEPKVAAAPLGCW